eukprot:COSAG05_NODE_13135_length_440_cov_1.665689_1_plen_82_part_01
MPRAVYLPEATAAAGGLARLVHKGSTIWFVAGEVPYQGTKATVMAGGKKRQAAADQTRAVFDAIDTDGSGTIDAEELGEALR